MFSTIFIGISIAFNLDHQYDVSLIMNLCAMLTVWLEQD